MAAKDLYEKDFYQVLGVDKKATADEIKKKYRMPIFFGGQIVFPTDTFFSRLLHNYTVFSIQKKLYFQGIEFVILPIKIRTHWEDKKKKD